MDCSLIQLFHITRYVINFAQNDFLVFQFSSFENRIQIIFVTKRHFASRRLNFLMFRICFKGSNQFLSLIHECLQRHRRFPSICEFIFFTTDFAILKKKIHHSFLFCFTDNIIPRGRSEQRISDFTCKFTTIFYHDTKKRQYGKRTKTYWI